MDGILNVYKEADFTSHDVVAKLRGILKTKKVGHGGTLDPQVTGVLPIAVGKATRLLEYMEAAGKVYEGEVTIGFSTETEDAYGEIVKETPVLSNLTEAEIDAAMANFIGQIQQIPPMYSAVKVNGKRLYEYARAGQTVERPVRQILIKEFVRTSSIRFENHLVKFDFRVACGKGTYVRTLAVDLAEKLGYAGHMSRLVRTASNGLDISNAKTLAEIEQFRDENRLDEILQPVEVAVSDLTRLDLNQAQFDKVCVGKFFQESEFDNLENDEIFAAFFNDKLVAIYQKYPEKPGILKPKKVFVQA